MKLEIHRMLTLSTAHITAAELQPMLDHGYPHIADLDDGCGAIFNSLRNVDNPEDAELLADYETSLTNDGLPTLPSLLAFARRHGCDYLRLDCDAGICPDLPTFPH